MRFLRDVLSADTNEEVLDQVYFTEVAKCFTPQDEQGTLDPVVAKKCIRNWLMKELEIMPNVPILALGRETEKLLRNIGGEIDSRPEALEVNDPEKKTEIQITDQTPENPRLENHDAKNNESNKNT